MTSLSVDISAESIAAQPARARHAGRRPPRLGPAKVSRPVVWTGRAAVLGVLLLAWHFLPLNPTLREFSPVFNEFFVSSPGQVVEKLGELATNPELNFWRNLWFTTQGTLLGCFFGLAASVVMALVLSNSKLLSTTTQPSRM